MREIHAPRQIAVALVVRFSTPDGWRQNAQPFRPQPGAPKLLGPTVGQRRPIDSTLLRHLNGVLNPFQVATVPYVQWLGIASE